MPTDLIVPQAGESITEVQIGRWFKAEGEAVKKDEPLVEIETDKVTLELPAPADGVVKKITHAQGKDAKVGDVIGVFEEGAAGEQTGKKPEPEERSDEAADQPERDAKSKPEDQAKAKASASDASSSSGGSATATVMPAAQRLLDEHGLKPADVTPSGPGGRLLKQDVLAHVNAPSSSTPDSNGSAPGTAPGNAPAPGRVASATGDDSSGTRETRTVPMTPLRKRIAANLVQAQQNAALLTTFNECDMSAVMDMRSKYNAVADKKTGQGLYEKKFGTKLGFMSFFVKAACDALQQFPGVNAEVDGDSIVYRDYCDVGIAIGGGKGLVVPVLRNAETLSFAQVELAIADYAKKARDNKLQLDDLTGGTFTITNGGVYGSLLSTPIVNPPQSGVLGMHGIVRRPVAVNPGTPDERIEVRPMMYLALTYDHRVVDGREAVTFLKRICDTIEDPTRLLMEV